MLAVGAVPRIMRFNIKLHEVLPCFGARPTLLHACRSAKRGALFLLAIEMAWFITNKSVENMPKALQYVFNPFLRPVRFCTSHARWLGWLAFSYLAVRSVQQGCQQIARLASLPTPPGSPRNAGDGAKKQKPHSPTQSEVDVAVSKALAPVKCEHCGSTACYGCCGGAGAGAKGGSPPQKVIQVPGWIMTPPANKNQGKKRQVKEEEAKGKTPGQKESKPGELKLVDLDPDLDIKYAKALKNMFQAANTAGVWVVNNLHHVMN